MAKVRGYKVFNPDWTCRNKQYTCPGTFEENIEELSLCENGMHFCTKLLDCFNYYDFHPDNKVAEVIAYGNVINGKDKSCTDKLEIVRELSWEEVLRLVNIGRNCTGMGNIGDNNTGNFNINDGNIGSYNTSPYNTGSFNTSSFNYGCHNSGGHNYGNWNAGWYNVGNHNCGNFNSGYLNSGDFNSCDYSSGCFNTDSLKIFLFNKPSDWTFQDWVNSYAKSILYKMPKIINPIMYTDMTDKSKKLHPEASITGRYLQVIPNSSLSVLRTQWWKKLPQKDKEVIMALPNFDKEIFRKTTGIIIED